MAKKLSCAFAALVLVAAGYVAGRLSLPRGDWEVVSGSMHLASGGVDSESKTIIKYNRLTGASYYLVFTTRGKMWQELQ